MPLTKILVASSRPDIEANIQNCLEGEPCRLVVAKDGKQTLDKVHTEQPDLVMVDTELSLIEGLDVMRRLKANSRDDTVLPIIALLTAPTNAHILQCLGNGADEVLIVPVESIQLKAKLRLILRLHGTVVSSQQKLADLHRLLDQVQEERDQVEFLLNRLIETDNHPLPNLEFILSPKAFSNGDLLLSAVAPDSSQYILLGDFSGHGLSSALGVLPVTQVFYAMVRKGLPIEAIAAELNKKLHVGLPANYYMATCLLRYAPDDQHFQIINAGMPAPRLFHPEKGVETRFESCHPPLGIVGTDDLDVSARGWPVDRAHILYAFSDGLVESVAWNNNQFGETGIDRALNDSDGTDLDLDELYRYLLRFRQGRPQQDDLSVLRYAFDTGVQAAYPEDEDSDPGVPSLSQR